MGQLSRVERAQRSLATRTGRSDCLLIDALRARAVRLYPRDEEKQEAAVTEFWSHLLVSETPGSVPVLARYDGQRPLAPWLIRVFQNWHLSKLRQTTSVTALPDDEIALPMDAPKADGAGRWHETFVSAAREWLDSVDDDERLLLRQSGSATRTAWFRPAIRRAARACSFRGRGVACRRH